MKRDYTDEPPTAAGRYPPTATERDTGYSGGSATLGDRLADGRHRGGSCVYL